ncbi:MAG: toll/interleukin-1 receptor domain-containing protein [Anaerolineae bacterium]|nr:toll/interleukin-1 receptor domain-containing protein [Anaerolineae bacterium]
MMYGENTRSMIDLLCMSVMIGAVIGLVPAAIALWRHNRLLAFASVTVCAIFGGMSSMTLTPPVALVMSVLAFRSQPTVIRASAKPKPKLKALPSHWATTTPINRLPFISVKKNAIFLSYRRDDSGEIVGRIYDRLVQQFGKEAVFQDLDSIPFGVDFRAHLAGVISNCGIVLAVIGNDWLDVRDEEGERRLDNPADLVRIEIETALQRDVPVVPLLVRDARLPREGDLPPSIADLAFRNGTAVRSDPDFHPDMDRLIHSIDQFVR